MKHRKLKSIPKKILLLILVIAFNYIAEFLLVIHHHTFTGLDKMEVALNMKNYHLDFCGKCIQDTCTIVKRRLMTFDAFRHDTFFRYDVYRMIFVIETCILFLVVSLIILLRNYLYPIILFFLIIIALKILLHHAIIR